MVIKALNKAKQTKTNKIKQNPSNHTNQAKPIKPNIPKPSLPKQTYQTQTYSIKPTKPNLNQPNQALLFELKTLKRENKLNTWAPSKGLLQCVVYFSHSYNPFPGRNHELC